MSDKKAPKFLKAGKVVLLLNGRQAGKKAVIVKSFDEGTPDRPYGHALVAGIMKYPLKITKNMSEKKIAKRSRVSHLHSSLPVPWLGARSQAPGGEGVAPGPALHAYAPASTRGLPQTRQKGGGEAAAVAHSSPRCSWPALLCRISARVPTPTDQAVPEVCELQPRHADAVRAGCGAEVDCDDGRGVGLEPDGEAECTQGGEEDPRGQVRPRPTRTLRRRLYGGGMRRLHVRRGCSRRDAARQGTWVRVLQLLQLPL